MLEGLDKVQLLSPAIFGSRAIHVPFDQKATLVDAHRLEVLSV
jgi:hypothetical protein